MKVFAIVLGLLVALAPAAGSAQAKPDNGHRKIVAEVEEIGFELPTPTCELGMITFSLVAPEGGSLGTGVSCIHSIVGCSFAAGCRATAFVDFTLTFPQGSVTAPVVIDEVWPTDTTVAQRAKGTITSGTGAFAGAKGSIKCNGGLEFTDTAVIPDLLCTVRTK
jgi:hypothetical protein